MEFLKNQQMIRKILCSFCVIMMIEAFVWLGIKSNNQEYYTARSGDSRANDAFGSAEYLHHMRMKPAAGEIEPADVIATPQATQQFCLNETGTATGLNWEEINGS